MLKPFHERGGEIYKEKMIKYTVLSVAGIACVWIINKDCDRNVGLLSDEHCGVER